MTDELVSYETAKLAQKAGFNEYCVVAYDENGELTLSLPSVKNTLYAPSQSLLQRWLRETHGIMIMIIPSREGFTHSVFHLSKAVGYNSIESTFKSDKFSTYEKALGDGLQKALTLITNI